MSLGTMGFTGFVPGGGGGGGVTNTNPIRITSADFADATHWNGANSAGRVILSTDNLQVYANWLPRFLTPTVEWARTALGMNVLLDGFDATQNDYEFYIFVS